MRWNITLTADKAFLKEDIIKLFNDLEPDFKSYFGLTKKDGFSWSISTDNINPSFNYLVVSSNKSPKVGELPLLEFLKVKLEYIGYSISI